MRRERNAECQQRPLGPEVAAARGRPDQDQQRVERAVRRRMDRQPAPAAPPASSGDCTGTSAPPSRPSTRRRDADASGRMSASATARPAIPTGTQASARPSVSICQLSTSSTFPQRYQIGSVDEAERRREQRPLGDAERRSRSTAAAGDRPAGARTHRRRGSSARAARTPTARATRAPAVPRCRGARARARRRTARRRRRRPGRRPGAGTTSGRDREAGHEHPPRDQHREAERAERDRRQQEEQRPDRARRCI